MAAAGAAVGLNAWPDKPEPLVRTMRLALEDAGLSPEDVDVVYASANATVGLDATEAEALSRSSPARERSITSLKGALGEFGASGAAACAAAFLCGREGRVPPIAGLARPIAAAARLNLAREAVDDSRTDRARQQFCERRRAVQRGAARAGTVGTVRLKKADESR